MDTSTPPPSTQKLEPLDPPILSRGPGTKEQWVKELAIRSTFGNNLIRKPISDAEAEIYDQKIYPRAIRKLIYDRLLVGEEEYSGPKQTPDSTGGKRYLVARNMRIKHFDETVTEYVEEVKLEIAEENKKVAAGELEEVVKK
jgi:hypothetical protein